MWKKFQFFEKKLIKDSDANSQQQQQQLGAEDEDSSPQSKLASLSVTCCTSGRGTLITGDQDGNISLIERDFTVTTFAAYRGRVSLLELARDRNLLVGCGVDDDETLTSAVKVWNMDRVDATNKVPPLVADVKLSWRLAATMRVPTCMACTSNMNHVAIGFANGVVALVTFDAGLRRPTLRFVCQHQGVSVTGVEFCGNGHLYVVTEAGVFYYPTDFSARDAEASPNGLTGDSLDPEGAGFGCVSGTEDGELVVGTPAAVFFYNEMDKCQCLAFGGEKRFVRWFRGNLVVVTAVPAPTRPGLGGRSMGAGMRAGGMMDQEVRSLYDLTVYDTRNKLIAYSDQKFSTITHVAAEWGSLFVFTSDGRIFELSEVDTQTKLESLFKKNLYTTAVTLATNQQYDQAAIAGIIVRYAEHLYAKGDYDGAIAQFIKTIGRLEPSYVIRKFLDAQKIHNLTAYLEALHAQHKANADHTTLLLNCYTKLKDADKLEHFLTVEDTESFDVETAIRVCRQGKYYDHALKLARKYREHDWFLKIQLEDKGDFDTALEYIASLDQDDAVLYLKKYGKDLVAEIPEATTNQLVLMCTGSLAPGAEMLTLTSGAAPSGIGASLNAAFGLTVAESPAPAQVDSSNPFADSGPAEQEKPLSAVSPSASTSSFSSVSSLLSNIASTATRKIIESTGGSSSNVGQDSENIDIPEPVELVLSDTEEEKVGDIVVEKKKPELVKAEDFIHIFVGRQKYLVKFLELVTERVREVSPIVYDTLLEMYLHGPEDGNGNGSNETTAAPTETEEEREERLDKARRLIMYENATYDPHHALVLAQRYEFRDGVMLLLEKLKMYDEIIQYHMENREFESIIRCCNKYGERDPNVWIQVLSYFSTVEGNPEKEIKEVLDSKMK